MSQILSKNANYPSIYEHITSDKWPLEFLTVQVEKLGSRHMTLFVVGRRSYRILICISLMGRKPDTGRIRIRPHRKLSNIAG